MTQVISAANDNKVVVINLLVSAMAADRQIDLDVLNIKVEELHDEIRKLVTEKIFPKDFLRNYARFRENGEALLKQDGSIMCSIGAVMSRSEAVTKLRELNKIKEEWAQQLTADEPGYKAMCDKHLLEMSQKAIDKGADPAQVTLLADHLRKRQPSWEEVAARFKFEFVVTPVTMEDSEFDADLYEAQRDSVVALREGVLGAVIQHVCKESMEILETLDKKATGSQSGEVKVNPRTVRRAQAMCVKLNSLAFIHPLIRPLHDALKCEMDKVPGNGFLTGGEFQNLRECLKSLRDQTIVWDRLKNGQPLIQVSNAITSSNTAQQAQATAQVTPVQTQQATSIQPASTAPAAVATVAAAPAVTTGQAVAATAVAAAQPASAPAVVGQAADEVEETAVPDEVESMPVVQEEPKPALSQNFSLFL
ncbi:hypothetical protein IIE18_11200 [Pseudomonas sp. V1]|uniref:DUF3150 domain-containing protein n=1 Tax=Pseudomonas arcuscaelestis TaxID=2710591 RepID=UPI00193EDB3A|nr:DUF3150 domain-containing protein [Pseudomonas arcuscaelestis]MBM3105707.1 hypothetical protein [Pseudomonas arcuscaelestis]